MKKPTLKTIPLDMTLTIGKYLRTSGECFTYENDIRTSYPHMMDISEITLAARLNDKEMLEHLIDRYPIIKKDHVIYPIKKDHVIGRYPIKDDISRQVALSGNLGILKWTIQQKKCPMGKDTFTYAACSGNFKMLKWLHNRGCPWQRGRRISWAAAVGGNLEIVQWLNDSPWDEAAARGAARGGHLHILEHLKEKGCPWNYGACEAAAEGGHLHILQYLKENGCPWDKSACRAAAEGGHLHILQYFKENGCPWNEEACRAAARGGHLHILEYLKENGCPWNGRACYQAARGGHLHVLQYLKENGCHWDDEQWDREHWGREHWGDVDIIDSSVEGQNIEMLDYLHGLGCPVYVNPYSFTWNVNLYTLEWLHDHGYEWTAGACHAAAKSGNLQALQWLRNKGCPWNDYTCILAAYYGYADVLGWAIENGCPEPSDGHITYGDDESEFNIYDKSYADYIRRKNNLLGLGLGCTVFWD